jgi:CRP-like cAMP-binding protein
MTPDELQLHPMFSGLTPGQVARLAPAFQHVHFAAGERIFGQGSPANCVYLLEVGEVALQLHPEDGGCLTIGHIHPGGLFGWSAVLGRARYTSSATSETDAEALVARGADLRAAMHADSTLGRVLLARMAQAAAGRTSDVHGQVARLIQNEITQGS